MTFFVLAADGNKYGPAEEAELTAWADEGRLRPETSLEDALTGEVRRADAVLPRYPWPTAAAVAEYPRPFGAPVLTRPRRSLWVAGLLTFLLCGAGQMYNRQVAKGFAFLAVTLTVGILTAGFGGYVVTILACVDACRTARRINAGEPVGAWSLF